MEVSEQSNVVQRPAYRVRQLEPKFLERNVDLLIRSKASLSLISAWLSSSAARLARLELAEVPNIVLSIWHTVPSAGSVPLTR